MSAPQKPGNTVVLGTKFTTKYHSWHESNKSVEHIKAEAEQELHSTVEKMKKKRAMDALTVVTGSAMSTVVPLSGLIVVLPEVIYKALEGGVKLGLVPILSCSKDDIAARFKQAFTQLKDTSQAGVMAVIENVVLELAKYLGVGDWLWYDVLKEVLGEVVKDSVTDAIPGVAILMTGVKYKLHRHSIKHVFEKLGKRAKVMHCQWIDENLGHKKVDHNATSHSPIPQGAYIPAAYPHQHMPHASHHAHTHYVPQGGKDAATHPDQSHQHQALVQGYPVSSTLHNASPAGYPSSAPPSGYPTISPAGSQHPTPQGLPAGYPAVSSTAHLSNHPQPQAPAGYPSIQPAAPSAVQYPPPGHHAPPAGYPSAGYPPAGYPPAGYPQGHSAPHNYPPGHNVPASNTYYPYPAYQPTAFGHALPQYPNN